MKYKRLDTCAICGKDVIYDTEEETLSCECPNSPVFAKISIKKLREMFTRT